MKTRQQQSAPATNFKIIPLSNTDEESWDELLSIASPNNLLQSYRFGEFKSLDSFQTLRYGALLNENLIGGVQIFIKDHLIQGKIAHIYRGPFLLPEFEKYILLFFENIKHLLRLKNITKIVAEPLLDYQSELLIENKWKPTTPIQPHKTRIIPLDPDKDTLLNSFKQKTRYNIRLAQRKGVEIIENNDRDGFELFLSAIKQTVERQSISLYTPSYFNSLRLAYKNSSILLHAFHEGDHLASLILIFHDTTAYYLFGGTTRLKRNLMGNYLLHFKAIQVAKEHGADFYDLWGVAEPDDFNFSKWKHLSKFKEGFGGEIVSFPKPALFILNKNRYRLERTVTAIRHLPHFIKTHFSREKSS